LTGCGAAPPTHGLAQIPALQRPDKPKGENSYNVLGSPKLLEESIPR